MYNDHEAIGSYIRNIRKEKGLTLKELEEKTGVSFSHLSRIERDERDLTFDSAKKIAKALKIRESLLLGRLGYVSGPNQLIEFYRRHHRFPEHITKEILEDTLKEIFNSPPKSANEEIPVLNLINDNNINNLFAEENIIGFEELSIKKTEKLSKPFYLYIDNNEMINDKIHKGDIVLISKDKEFKKDRIYLIHDKKEGFKLRRIYDIQNNYLVQASSPESKPILRSKRFIDIIGYVVEAKRRF